jgi:hypothetical protein
MERMEICFYGLERGWNNAKKSLEASYSTFVKNGPNSFQETFQQFSEM